MSEPVSPFRRYLNWVAKERARQEAELAEKTRSAGPPIAELVSDQLNLVNSHNAVALRGGEIPAGQLLAQCPGCGRHSVVPSADMGWLCPACKYMVAAERCTACEVVYLEVLQWRRSKDGLTLVPDPLNRVSVCPACQGRRTLAYTELSWLGPATRGVSPGLSQEQQLELLRSTDRRAISGVVLELEGLSGLAVGDVRVDFDEDALTLAIGPEKVAHRLGYEAVSGLQIAGRGEIATKVGGGWIGGGFGFTGALEGAWMASVLNKLTTRTYRQVESIVFLTWMGGRLALLNGVYLPEHMNQLLSPVLSRLQKSGAPSSLGDSHPLTAVPATPPSGPTKDPGERLKKLQELLAGGLISNEEFDAERARILSEI